MKYIFVLLAMLLLSCGGANQAYLDRDWEAFEEECAHFCGDQESHPSQEQIGDTTIWSCGCDPWIMGEDEE